MTSSSANLSSDTADSDTESRRARSSSTLYAGAMTDELSPYVSVSWVGTLVTVSGLAVYEAVDVGSDEQDVKWCDANILKCLSVTTHLLESFSETREWTENDDDDDDDNIPQS